ncbi:hypothetical protein [Dactylosporangium matsuzakiense]|nr:hypothetical protein [Dactylosporangium matsuzakiense]UWZ47705.1 hypothetical protein Dmats_15645 [Dactylosporangium matsuzakiense]
MEGGADLAVTVVEGTVNADNLTLSGDLDLTGAAFTGAAPASTTPSTSRT